MKDEYLIGRKPILDAIEQGKSIEKIWIESSLRGEIEKEIRHAAKAHAIPLINTPKEKLRKLVNGANHQGLVAQISWVEYAEIEDVMPFIYEQGKMPKILILDKVEDVRNMGAIARSAVWFGFNALVLPQKDSARINSMTIKTSAGAILNIPVCRVKSLVNTVQFLKDSGLKIYASDMDGEGIGDQNFDHPLALIMGSEENGVSKGLKSHSDKILSIIGTKAVESLNVSVASAILMYEMTKNSDLSS